MVLFQPINEYRYTIIIVDLVSVENVGLFVVFKWTKILIGARGVINVSPSIRRLKSNDEGSDR